MRDALIKLWQDASTPKRGLLVAAPIAVIAIIAVVAVLAASGGGGGDGDEQVVASPTAHPSVAPSPTAASAGLLTPISLSPGDELTHADLAARGVGTPGRGDFTGDKLIIPKIGVEAPFTNKVVGTDGRMPNPNGPEDVAYYDFSQWPTAGGLPGKGGNIVMAGHVDYIRYGPAVFWRLHELQVGDVVTIQLKDGTRYDYKIEFNKQVAAGDADWTDIVTATADESITLITCGGEFEAGHYDHRTILWGRRV